MKKELLCLIIPAIFYADSLTELLNYAHINNNLVISQNLTTKAKQQEVEASKSSRYPTIDIGVSYQNLNERTRSLAGDIYGAKAIVSYDIYDGGNKSYLIKQKQNELKVSSFDELAFKKSLSLEIVQNFFNIKNIESSLVSLQEERISLNAQLQRVKKFYEADLSTKDNVDKLQSAYDTNSYNIQSLEFEKLTLLKDLELKVGKEISTLDNSKFKKNMNLNLEIDDEINSLKAKESSFKNQADSLNSVYSPKINISDSYSLYDYDRTDSLHPEGVDNQNKLMLSLNLRLYDNGSTKKSREAILINKNVIKSQIDYKTKKQKMLFDLSISRIKTSELKIKSSNSALKSAKSAFKTISKKYKVGIVDNVVYLDALSVKTNATSLYHRSLNDLELAYATSYYYAGKNIQEFINEI